MAHRVRIPHNPSVKETSSEAGFGWSSTNWSGYAISTTANKSYSSVNGSWTVPAVKAPPRAKPTSFWHWLVQFIRILFGLPSGSDVYSATWIGIDGFHNTSLIQTGTARNIVDRQAQYYAWWEILPSPETVIDTSKYPVFPGDQIQAVIFQQPSGSWTIQLTNTTQGWTFAQNDLAYCGPQTSAEWIEETPEVGASVATLADYGETTFRSCKVNGENPNLTTSEGGTMVQHGQVVSVPSVPGPNGDSFNVACGSTMPNPPTS